MGIVYSPGHLPPLLLGSTGVMAHPRTSATFACVRAPQATSLWTAWLDNEGVNAGTAPQVARIDLEAGDIHMLLDVSGRNGIAVDANLAEGGTYRIVNPSVDSASDARMGFMRGYWAQVGFAPPVMLLQRTAPLEVVGQLSERSEAVGREFSPSKGPLTTLTTNCFVVRGMNGDVAVVTEKDMGRMFTHLTDINGKRIKNLHK